MKGTELQLPSVLAPLVLRKKKKKKKNTTQKPTNASNILQLPKLRWNNDVHPSENVGLELELKKKKKKSRPLKKQQQQQQRNTIGGAPHLSPVVRSRHHHHHHSPVKPSRGLPTDSPGQACSELDRLYTTAGEWIAQRESLLYKLNAMLLCYPVHPASSPTTTRSSNSDLLLTSFPTKNEDQAKSMLLDMAYQLQFVGINCVEAIVEWMLLKGEDEVTPPIYHWKGQHYLLKMFHDLDFVPISLRSLGLVPSSTSKSSTLSSMASALGCFRAGNPLVIGSKQRLGRVQAAHLIILEIVERDSLDRALAVQEQDREMKKIPFPSKEERGADEKEDIKEAKVADQEMEEQDEIGKDQKQEQEQVKEPTLSVLPDPTEYLEAPLSRAAQSIMILLELDFKTTADEALMKQFLQSGSPTNTGAEFRQQFLQWLQTLNNTQPLYESLVQDQSDESQSWLRQLIHWIYIDQVNELFNDWQEQLEDFFSSTSNDLVTIDDDSLMNAFELWHATHPSPLLENSTGTVIRFILQELKTIHSIVHSSAHSWLSFASAPPSFYIRSLNAILEKWYPLLFDPTSVSSTTLSRASPQVPKIQVLFQKLQSSPFHLFFYSRDYSFVFRGKRTKTFFLLLAFASENFGVQEQQLVPFVVARRQVFADGMNSLASKMFQNIHLSPHFESPFGQKQIQDKRVEEAEGHGPRKEFFDLLGNEWANGWYCENLSSVISHTPAHLLSTLQNHEEQHRDSKEATFWLTWTELMHEINHLRAGNRLKIIFVTLGEDETCWLEIQSFRLNEVDCKVLSCSLSFSSMSIHDYRIELYQQSEANEAYFHYCSASDAFYFPPSPEDQDEGQDLMSDTFERMGWFMALAITNHCTFHSPFRLHPLFFKYLIAHLNFDELPHRAAMEELLVWKAELRNLDPELYRSMQTIEELGDEEFQQFLQLEQGEDDAARWSTPQEYLQAQMSRRIYSEEHRVKFRALAKGFGAGLGFNSSSSGIRSLNLTPDDYDDFLTCAPLSRAWWNTVSNFSAQELAQLLKFVTGVKTFPLPYTESFRIELPFTMSTPADARDMLHRLPQAHTCENIIELPNYFDALEMLEMDTSDEEVEKLLKKKLIFAMEHGHHSYGLDMINTELKPNRPLSPAKNIVSKSTSSLEESLDIPTLRDHEEEESLDILTLGDHGEDKATTAAAAVVEPSAIAPSVTVKVQSTLAVSKFDFSDEEPSDYSEDDFE